IAEGSGSNLQGLDNYGVVYSKDGGLSFEQRLHGEKILSIGFFKGSIYAAGEQGVFISSDGGNTWEMNNRFKTQTNLITEKASFQSIASNDNYLFIGTSEGLLWTEDPEGPWNIERVNFPLTGGNNFEQESSNVSSYAYPNPYSPELHGQIRIRFDSSTSASAHLRIFDFSNTLVYETTEQTSSTGAYEILWNGYNMKGHQVDNGVYFYQITLSNKTLEGKILVIH
ncbi:MAG: T9SS C-terminal target domain-containing protein, partial [Bacteroidetes bacterium]|nr:T9SS C-terminal target domain-containing protein [Bacteroidota bacterium]